MHEKVGHIIIFVILSVIFTLLVIVFVASLNTYYFTYRLNNDGIHISAKVISKHHTPLFAGHELKYRYLTVQGQERVDRAYVTAAFWEKCPQGSKVPIVYSPYDNSVSKINNEYDRTLWVTSIINVLFLIPLLGFGWALKRVFPWNEINTPT